jgi:hypothetical protein
MTGLLAGCTTTVKPPTMSTSAGSVVATTSVQAAPAAADILDRAKRNATAATSGAFKGQLVQDGTTILVDFKGTSDGSSSDVTIEVGSQGKVRVISISDEVFIQGDAAFWQSQGLPDAAATEGKFVRAPKAVPDLTNQLSLNQFLDKAFAAVTPDQLSDTVRSEQVAGVETWVLTDDSGAAEGALYVSKDRFEVVRFTGSSGTPAELDFSRWNEDLGIAAPPASQVVGTP